MNKTKKMIVIFSRKKGNIETKIHGEHIFFPENDMTFEDLFKKFDKPCDVLVTNNPILLNQFRRDQVYVLQDSGLEPIEFNPYGTDFSIIAKRLCGLGSLQSEVFKDDIKARLQSPSDAIEYLESQVGDSMEKAYLLGKLRKAKEDAQ